MNQISLKVDNLKAVQDALRLYGAKAERNISRVIEATALTINRDVKDLIDRGAKSGRVYQRRNIEHRASAPGEAPATDTGFLVSDSSIYYERNTPLSATVGSRLAYAYYLEFGTVRIAPRPAWLPATEKNREKFNRLLEEGIRRAAP